MPGEKIALLGDNGAGKSTIIKLLTRLYDPTAGSILLEGVDLREYDLNTLRCTIGALFQDFVRFDMDVRYNIGFGSIADLDSQSKLAAAAINAGAAPLIDSLPNKWEQLLGRRFHGGIDLSGGEWQKVARLEEVRASLIVRQRVSETVPRSIFNATPIVRSVRHPKQRRT